MQKHLSLTPLCVTPLCNELADTWFKAVVEFGISRRPRAGRENSPAPS